MSLDDAAVIEGLTRDSTNQTTTLLLLYTQEALEEVRRCWLFVVGRLLYLVPPVLRDRVL